MKVFVQAVDRNTLDLLRVRGLASAEGCDQARELLVRIVQMLTKLQQRMAA